jgi:hypothetical protein
MGQLALVDGGRNSPRERDLHLGIVMGVEKRRGSGLGFNPNSRGEDTIP